MSSEIQVDRQDVEIYYSEKVNEKVDGSSWTNTFTTNAKSFKLVFLNGMKHGEVANFNYMVKVPANLGNGVISKGTYAVYYNNNAEEGNKQNVILATPVAISTTDIPVFETKTVLTDANTR